MQKAGTLVLAFFKSGLTRLELATPCVTGRYSNQLSYNPRCESFCITIIYPP